MYNLSLVQSSFYLHFVQLHSCLHYKFSRNTEINKVSPFFQLKYVTSTGVSVGTVTGNLPVTVPAMKKLAFDRVSTWNHPPLGSAGFNHEAKKIALVASSGQEMSIRIPNIKVQE